MKKKIVFFDGDGTLWYPKTTKYNVAPHWVYHNEKTKDNPNEHLELTPFLVNTMTKLKKKNIKTVILSASPYPPEKAHEILKEKVDHLGISKFFDEVHATPPIEIAKGKFILNILSRHNLYKKDALMVGDTYIWDCKSAKDVGVQALLIDSKYRKNCPNGKRAKRVIKELNSVLDYT